jgi:hypothetical protein
MGDRTALLICCSRKEAEEVRRRAKLNRRKMSGYVLFIVSRCIAIDERWFEPYRVAVRSSREPR